MRRLSPGATDQGEAAATPTGPALTAAIDRLFRGDRYHRSRFHDEHGQLVDWVGLSHAPAALAGHVVAKLVGWRPALPSIPFRAITAVAAVLDPTRTRALEFGSGMSTIWLADRCRTVHSVESDPRWHARVQGELARRRLSNVTHELRSLGEYPYLGDFDPGAFDLAVVDGMRRTDCMKSALATVRPGGWIYLDNADKGNGTQAALGAARLLEGSASRIYRFRDFVPGQFGVTLGMLGKLD